MDKIFKDDATIHRSTPDVPDVHALCQRIARVIIDINADVIAILEGIPLAFSSFSYNDRFFVFFSVGLLFFISIRSCKFT